MEQRALEAQVEGMRRQFQEAGRGQILSAVLATLGSGAFLAAQGQPWPGALLGIVGISGIFAAFLAGRDRDESPAPHEPTRKRVPKRKPKSGEKNRTVSAQIRVILAPDLSPSAVGGWRMMIRFRCRSVGSWQVILSMALFAAAGQANLAYGQDRVSITPRLQPGRKLLPSGNIRLDVNLVLTPVSVTDSFDRPMVELHKGNFHIFEDDAEQDITSFSISDAPVSVGLVFDSSRSMRSRIEDSRMAVGQFMQTSAPEDEFLLVRFSDTAELLTPFTHDADEISRLLNMPSAHGFTALLDAICLATQQMHRASNPRKVLLVLTDGVDNNSRYSERELERLLREADVRVYAIGLFQRPEFLEKIASETGGRTIWVRRLMDLPEAIHTLSRQIRSEYLIGYMSHRPENDGKYHKVRVEVEPPGDARLPIHTSWRRGYVALDE